MTLTAPLPGTDSVEPVDIFSRRLELHPQVALRPEPFGALAYHYDSRRLIFLKHPDVVAVVRSLGAHNTVDETLQACSIPPNRWQTFADAIVGLLKSEILRDRPR